MKITTKMQGCRIRLKDVNTLKEHGVPQSYLKYANQEMTITSSIEINGEIQGFYLEGTDRIMWHKSEAEPISNNAAIKAYFSGILST